MESRNIIIVGIATLIVGLVLGVVFAPSLAPNGRDGGMMGRGNNMMSENIDRHFIEQMIPHHEGAIAMAKLALERSSRPEIISLSNGIIEAQTREIDDMKSVV